jgi:beta-glucanase (GH16 family)
MLSAPGGLPAVGRLLSCGLLASAALCCVQTHSKGRSVFGPATSVPLSSSAKPGWHLVWHDEFDKAIGPDWTFDIGTGKAGWGNNERQFYTARLENARVENGALVIEARHERYSSSEYTSARLKTEGRAAFTYGRIEARIQVPRGEGLWPAFWALGDDLRVVGWPRCGEIDVMENIGREPGSVHATVHGPGYSGNRGVGGFFDLPSGAFADVFHLFAVEWDSSALRFSVDDTLYRSITPADVPGAWVFGHPFFLLLNLAVGGRWPGDPNADTAFPARMKVDFVRVYDRSAVETEKSGRGASPAH